jgi:SAM-dependent methyltransferase
MHDPLDSVAPLDEDRSTEQVQWLCAAANGKRVLDVGCGVGRVTAPLAASGIHVTAIDNNPDVLEQCQANAPTATCVLGDMGEVDAPPGSFDVVCCLGNTFCLLHDVHEALGVLRHWRTLLSPGGVVVIDDIPHDLWCELADGHWINGVADDGRQLVWSDCDAVFALRATADASRSLDDTDRRMRLWTMGALALLAEGAQLQGPVRVASASVLVFSDPSD